MVIIDIKHRKIEKKPPKKPIKQCYLILHLAHLILELMLT